MYYFQKKSTNLIINYKFFFLDTMGLHRIENPSHVKGAISLHLYTPAYSECKTFVEESGHTRASGKMTFYTVDGKKVNYCETSQ